jgi:tetratricopeptide (TPR) repeat protein
VRDFHIPWKWVLISNAVVLLVHYADRVAVVLANVFGWSGQFIDKWNKRVNQLIAAGEQDLHVGNYGQAENSLLLAATEAERHGVPAARRAVILRNVAEAQRKQNKLAEAEQTIRQAMAMTTGSTGPGRSQYADCLDVLADVARDRGNYPQAQTALQESLKLEESVAKPNPELMARRRQKLALAYHDAGDYTAAASHFIHALDLHEQTFGAEHAETGRVLSETGAALHKAGECAKALACLERAIQIQQKTSGEDSPEVTQDLYYLAMACEDSGRLDQAVAHYERLLMLRRRQVTGNEFEVAEVFFYLARVYLRLDRLALAEEMAKSAILIMDRKPGPELASALEILANIYERSDRTEEAAAASERARFILTNAVVAPKI